MSQTTVTKSIRLSPDESAELANLSEQMAISEAALMKKWVQEGIQMAKLESAIADYIQRKVDLRGGAAMAGVSYNRFMREVQARNIVILEDDGHFLDRLEFLADAFDNQLLHDAVQKVRERSKKPVTAVA